VLVTNVGADYTKLGSFGSAQDFGNNLVVSMDRTYLLRRNRNAGPVQVRTLSFRSFFSSFSHFSLFFLFLILLTHLLLMA